MAVASGALASVSRSASDLLLLAAEAPRLPVLAAGGGAVIEETLIQLLPVFIIAAGVGIFVAKIGRFPYTIALLLAGLGLSVLSTTSGQFGRLIDIRLSAELIFLVLLPPLLFEGAATTDLERLRRNLVPVLVLAVAGLAVAVVLLGVVGTYVFSAYAPGFTLLLALLFASMALPTDPVSVLALFEELGAPERLAVLIEGESLVNDGVGVVLFSTFLVLVREGAPTSRLFDPADVALIGLDVVVVSLGGLVVGFVAGYAVFSVMRELDEHMTEIVLTFVLAYGSFVLAEHYLHVSGVIATVVAGLFIGNRGADDAMSPQTKVSVFNALETAAFLVNTFIFIMIGVTTPVAILAAHGRLILVAIVLVLLARAAVVYPLTALANRFVEPSVSLEYQHVLVWGGLHGSIPIALVLGLPRELASGAPFPLREELRAMVFGVAAFSLVVQGLTMSNLLDRLGVVTRSESAELYELLLGRARAVDEALDAAERLHDAGEIPGAVYDDFTAEYEREKDDLNDAIAALLREHPDLAREQLLAGERQVLQREKSAVMDAARRGVISDDVAERLLEEVDIKLDRVRDGERTVGADEEAYTEFWRERAREFGLDADLEVETTDDEQIPGEKKEEGKGEDGVSED
ncbi:MAG: Na+/H+ antiporter [Haloglomus sp.]